MSQGKRIEQPEQLANDTMHVMRGCFCQAVTRLWEEKRDGHMARKSLIGLRARHGLAEQSLPCLTLAGPEPRYG